MIFQPKLFFQNFSLNTEVRKCYINFGDLGFIGRMKPKYFSGFLYHPTTLLEPIFWSENFGKIEGTLVYRGGHFRFNIL